MTWRVARSLDVLLDEINAAAPNRSKVSDGSIGDAAHASRSSDHNPWVTYRGLGVVRARDFTHDPAGGLDCHALADALVPLIGKHPALRSGAYIIWNRRIISTDRLGEGWRYYGGSNPHTQHLHVSVATSPTGFDSTAPWGVMAQEDPMSDYADQLARIEAKIDRLDQRNVNEAKRDKNARERDKRRHQRVVGLLKGIRDDAQDDATRADIDAAVAQLEADS